MTKQIKKLTVALNHELVGLDWEDINKLPQGLLDRLEELKIQIDEVINADLLASGDIQMLVLDPKKPEDSVKNLDAVLKKRLED